MDDAYIGKRVMELRLWRRLSLEATAGLAGISKGYLSMIENGKRPVTTRHLLEALAEALSVATSDLLLRPWEWQSRGAGADDVPELLALESALDAYEIGHDPGEPARPWPVIAAEVERLVDLTQIHADYATQAVLVPGLLGELHSLLVRAPKLRQEVLLALVRVYTSATWVAKILGSGGLALMAVSRAQHCADELEAPQWRGYTAWLRGVTTGALNRDRQYQRAVTMADELSSAMDDREVAQAVGQLHLSAALAAAAQADRGRAALHLDTADSIADRLDAPVNDFAKVWFGKTNVGIWRVTIGLELDEGLKVAQAARGLDVEAIPSPARRAVFYSSVGRGLIGERQKDTRAAGLRLLLRAEKLAPQHIRGDVFAREAVSSLLRLNQGDSPFAREVRGLAYRMRLSPTG